MLADNILFVTDPDQTLKDQLKRDEDIYDSGSDVLAAGLEVQTPQLLMSVHALLWTMRCTLGNEIEYCTVVEIFSGRCRMGLGFGLCICKEILCSKCHVLEKCLGNAPMCLFCDNLITTFCLIITVCVFALNCFGNSSHVQPGM